MMMRRSIATLTLLVWVWAVTGCGPKTSGDYEPVSTFMDIHGIAVHPTDGSVLYVATHHGLIRGVEDKDWALVGRFRADFMGFSLHPTDGKVMYGSGHYPPQAPNIGVAKSTDGGLTWEIIALKGKVDFHTMAISRANPQLLWGWYAQRLHRSQDAAKTWEIVPANGVEGIAALAPDPRDADTVWAASTQGLYRSQNAGLSFDLVAFPGTPVATVAISPQDPSVLYVALLGEGLRKSLDGGQNWEAINQGIALRSDDAIEYLAIDPQNPRVVYAATYRAGIFKSADAGQSWKVIKPSE